MNISGLFEDETWALFGRVVFLTLVYAAIVWVPLRGTSAIVKRVQLAREQRLVRRRAQRARSMESDLNFARYHHHIG